MAEGPLKAEWYGIPFTSGSGVITPVARWQADLLIWQRHKEPPFSKYRSNLLNPISEHMLRACRDLFTPKQLRIHRWFEEEAQVYTEGTEVIFLGSASSGKSHFMGYAMTLELAIAIGDLYACMVSTDKGTLQQRSFASALECLNNLKANRIPVPLKYVAQKTAIIPEADSDDLQVTTSMVKGVAISEGSDQDAKRSMLGIHRPRVRSCADELENMGPRAKAFLSAQANARMGAIDYKMVVAFNPQSISAPGCLLATPDVPGGWGGLNPDTDFKWKTKGGRSVLRFDALQSPGLADPTLTFLPTRASLDALLESLDGNQDHPDFWAMARGFPALSRPDGTILTDAEVITFKMEEPCVWRGNTVPMVIGGLDPAFTADGDDCVLQLADVGHTELGALTICFRQPLKLKLEASTGVPMSYQIVGQLRAIMQDTGLRMANLAIDDSGSQSVADIVAKEIGPGFLRVLFGGRASESPMSLADSAGANKKVGNMGTEIWSALAEFGRYGQIRGLSKVASSQLTRRRLSAKRFPKILETKAEFKKRSGLGSPDEADAAALCMAVARFVLGVRPGASMLEPQGRSLPVASPMNMDRARALNNLRSTYSIRS